MALFICLFYTPAWLSCSVAVDAAVNDLQLHQDLLRHKELDEQVASAALAVLNRHPWYLRPQTAILSLCSDKVSADDKAEMAMKLLGMEPPEEYADETIVITKTTRLPHLISDQSRLVFAELHISGDDWLALPVEEWAGDCEYGKFERF